MGFFVVYSLTAQSGCSFLFLCLLRHTNTVSHPLNILQSAKHEKCYTSPPLHHLYIPELQILNHNDTMCIFWSAILTWQIVPNIYHIAGRRYLIKIANIFFQICPHFFPIDGTFSFSKYTPSCTKSIAFLECSIRQCFSLHINFNTLLRLLLHQT